MCDISWVYFPNVDGKDSSTWEKKNSAPYLHTKEVSQADPINEKIRNVSLFAACRDLYNNM